MTGDRDEGGVTARVPADVDRPDEVLFGLSARQVAVLAVVAVVLLAGWRATAGLLPAVVCAAVAVVLGGVAVGVVVGRRDGLGVDELVVAAARQRLCPRRLVPAAGAVAGVPGWVSVPVGPLPAPLRLPAEAITTEGVVDLGKDGVAVVCACSTVNFGLRTPGEQAGLVAAFAGWLNSLTGRVQVLIRADRIDLAPLITRLEADAARLPDPALEAAAHQHAAWLARLASSRDLLRRQVLLVLREPAGPGRGGRQAAERRVLRRAAEAARALAGCQVTVNVLDGAAAAAVLAAAAAPYDPRPAGPCSAGPGAVITATPPPEAGGGGGR
jgi:hypothetical protein